MASKFGHEFNFVVGGRVRCQQADGRTRTAAVAYVNDDGTVDLIYDSSGGADGLAASNVADEEDGVDPARLTVLTGTVAEAQAEAQAVCARGRIGARGHKGCCHVFALKDFEAALGKYNEALSVLGSQQVTVGSTVLIREKGSKEFAFHFVPALVSIVDSTAKTVDVMYAEDDDSEEDDVAMSRLHVLPPDTLEVSAPLQCTLHLNCAVCNLKLKRMSAAIGTPPWCHHKFSRRKNLPPRGRKSGDRAKVGIETWVKGSS